MCWVLLPLYPCLPSRTQIPPSSSAVHSAPGQKQLLMVLSEVAAQGLAQGNILPGEHITSMAPLQHPWARDVKPTQPCGLQHRLAPVCFDSFLPHCLCPFGPRWIWLHSLPKSSAVLFSFHPQCPENLLTAIIRLFLMACCSARLLGVDCKLTNWLEAFICQLCSEILLLFN